MMKVNYIVLLKVHKMKAVWGLLLFLPLRPWNHFIEFGEICYGGLGPLVATFTVRI